MLEDLGGPQQGMEEMGPGKVCKHHSGGEMLGPSLPEY